MANPSSMPVKKRANTRTRPMSPAITSLIPLLYNLHDVGGQHQSLDQAYHPDSINHRVKGDMEGGRDFARTVQIAGHLQQVPADEGEKPHAEEPGEHMDPL